MLLLLGWQAEPLGWHGPGKGMVVSPVSGQGEVKRWTIGGDLNSSVCTYVDYDDNVTLTVLVCVFVDLIYSLGTQVGYL